MTLPKDLLSTREYDDRLIIALPESEYGRVFLSRIREWLDKADEDYFLSLKICDEDIRQDFRFKAGVIAALKRVLQEPDRLRKELNAKR
ncbi:hypothetical protein LDC_2234 [sediment metagenome]|uniref:Uncharacterized protein n=1 Tax=sediment metagenome TaxID=749907 RepID=D9PL11_9ZZZZ